MRRPRVLETKIASWGGLLRRAACIGCGEICWFDGTRFLCGDCAEDEPVAPRRMPLIPNSVKDKPPDDE